MAKVHVLEADNNGSFKVVIHTPMPGGNNSVGNSWKNVWVASGRNVTSMTEGNGLGQITTAEKALVESGDVIEIHGRIHVRSGGATMASVDNLADQIVNAELSKLAETLRYFGHTQEDQGA